MLESVKVRRRREGRTEKRKEGTGIVKMNEKKEAQKERG